MKAADFLEGGAGGERKRAADFLDAAPSAADFLDNPVSQAGVAEPGVAGRSPEDNNNNLLQVDSTPAAAPLPAFYLNNQPQASTGAELPDTASVSPFARVFGVSPAEVAGKQPALPGDPVLPDGRSADRLKADIEGGVMGVAAADLPVLVTLLEQGKITDPESVLAKQKPFVSPEAFALLEQAAKAGQVASAGSVLDGLDEDALAFMDSLVRGATFNEADRLSGNANAELAAQAQLAGQDDLAQSIAASQRGGELIREQRRDNNPISAFAGELAGSSIPFVKGVQLLRAERLARGLPAIAPGTAGVVAEGAKVGGPQAFLYRPDGSEQMSTADSLKARTEQTVIGLALGGLLDAGGTRLVEFLGRMRDRRARAKLEAEAADNGYSTVDEYLDATLELVPDEAGGVVVRPKADFIDGLPGEQVANDNVSVDAGVGANDGDVIGPAYRELPPPPDRQAELTDNARRAQQRTQADELERLARASTDGVIRADLLRQARALRARADSKPAEPLSPKQRFEERMRVDPENDDLLTAIRKLGGIDTDIEADVRGRFSHVPRSGFGLPAVERPGKGQNLDDLAEQLWEIGYLREHDKNELLDRLYEAEAAPQYSYNRTGESQFEQMFNDHQENLAGAQAASDADWRWEPDGVDVADADFVIDTDAGTVVPSRPVTEDDLIRIHEEEKNAERFFALEGDEDGSTAATFAADERGGLSEAGAIRDAERVPYSAAGRPGDKPGQGEALTVDSARGEADNIGNEVRQPDNETFRADAGRGESQLELFTSEKNPTPEVAQVEMLGQQVAPVKVGRLPTAIRQVNSAEEAAHVVAAIRKDSQEGLYSIVTDDAGKVLQVMRLSRGGIDSAYAQPGLMAGAVHSVPGAKRVWFAHNHPSGDAVQSSADRKVTRDIDNLLAGSGVESEGMVVVAPGGRFTHIRANGSGVAEPRRVPAAARRDSVDVVERRFVRSQPNDADGITDPASLYRTFNEKYPGRSGVLLMNTKGQPVGFVEMTASEMEFLRDTGADGNTPGARLMAAIDRSNATRFAVKIDTEDTEVLQQVAENLKLFSNASGYDFVDAITPGGFSSVENLDVSVGSDKAFYSNPFIPAGKAFLRDIGLHPGQNAAAAFSGGAVGGLSSDEEIGTAEWWLDVARGAVIGTGSSQALRKLNLIGRGSIADNALSRVGDWIESLPLIGRGPSDLVELKRKQRLMQQLIDRQTEEVGRELLRRFTPDERAMMADIIERRGMPQEVTTIYRQAMELDKHITDVAEKMKKLGMLPEDLETGGYLHRYYAKHLGLDKLFRSAKSQTLSGSYTIARGTDSVFESEFLSDAVRQRHAKLLDILREIERIEKTSDLLSADDADRLAALREQRKLLMKDELVEYVGLQNGKPRSFIFLRDEVPRVDSGEKPVFAQLQKPEPGLSDKPFPVAPGVANLEPTDRVWNLKGARDGKVLLHRDWTKAERRSWGEIEDAGYRYVRGMAEVSHDLSLATLYDTVSRRADWVRNEPVLDGKHKWIEVPKTKVGRNSPLQKYGKLAGKWVRADVWNAMKHYGRPAFGPGPKIPFTEFRIGSLYRSALNKWKLYKTVYNPVTHFNNTYSNVEMLYMAGYTPADLANGLKHSFAAEESKLWREARDTGLFGTDWASTIVDNSEGGGSRVLDDLAEQLRTQSKYADAELVTSKMMELKDWWINSVNAVKGADTKLRSGVELARAVSRPVTMGLKFARKPVDIAARSAQRLYRFEDNVFKMAVYAKARRSGMSPEKAAEEAERYFFDYNDLPQAVKLVRDLPIGSPFISYTYLAIPAIARNVVRNPEKVLALVAGYEALNYWGLQQQGEIGPGEYWATAEAYDEVAPPWEKGRALWGARNTVRLPYLDSYKLALGRSHALGNPFMVEAGGREKLPEVPGVAGFWGSSFVGSNPLHSILDVVVNEDWRGKPIYQPGDPEEVKVRKTMAYLYQSWAPSNALIPGSYQQSKILDGLANDVRKAREAGIEDGMLAAVVDSANAIAEDLGMQGFTGLDRADNEILTRDALLGSFGVKVRPLRVEQSVDFESSRINREIREKHRATGRQARLNAEGRISDRQLQDYEALQQRDIEELEKKKDKLFNAEDFLRGRAK